MIEWLNNSSLVWSKYFAEAIIQNTIFLTILLGLLAFLKNVPARIKYSLALLGIIKMLIPPFVPLVWEISSKVQVLSAWNTHSIQGVVTDVEVVTRHTPSLSWLGLVFIVWSVIVLFLLILTLRSSFLLRKTLKSSWRLQSVLLSQQKIELWQNDKINMPISLGLFVSRIYVPPQWDEWSPECREMVLRHELAHLQRNDSFVQILQAIVSAIFFFHPLVWILNQRMNDYREMACDENTVGFEKSASIKYSRYLIDIAEKIVLAPATCPSASALIKQKKSLLKRVNYLLMEAPMQQISKTRNRFIFWGLLLLIPVFSWHLSFGSTEKIEKAGDAKIEIRVEVKNGLDIVLAGNDVNKLKEALEKQLPKNREGLVASLTMDKDLPMETVYELNEMLRKLDLPNVAYKSDDLPENKLNLPSKDMEKKIEKLDAKNVLRILMNREGMVICGANKPVEISDVDKIVKQELEKRPNIILQVQIDEKANYNQQLLLLDELKTAGANRILIQRPDKKRDMK